MFSGGIEREQRHEMGLEFLLMTWNIKLSYG